MRINNEGRSSKMVLRFSPIQEAEAYDYPIKGSSDESDIKRRNLAFDVFRRTSGGSLNYSIGQGRDRNDDRGGSSWSSVPYVTYFLFCLNILVFAIYICNSSVDVAGLEPKLLINNFTTTLAGTNITQMRQRPNPWIGPSLKFLIGIGAMYAPCVREDAKIKGIVKEAAVTPPDVLGCCEIRKRGLAAMATYRDCKRFGFGHGMIWTKEAQCGDMQLQVKNSVILRPCCVGTEGKCMMLARVDCKKLDGLFHNAGPEHCSQINCLGDICQFYENNSTYTPLNPNQWWRLFVSPFYHYGGLHLIMTLVGYISIGKQLERSVGHIRIFIIYLGTAMMGLLTGGVFLPYHVHIGGTASVFGLFGVLQIQLIQTWKTHVKPCTEIALLFFFFLFYAFLGLLSMVDNYEHIGGYWAGLLLGCLLLPYVTFGSWKLGVRRVVFAFSLSLTIISVLFLMCFYFIDPDFTFPEELVYFSCLPFSSGFCENDDVEIK
ncbi:inactive rhomboid protein 2-like [Lineus longissimus]|uniref:inactive rhomboid protein 2-like n=1 Tax=Lineus longissimus TaxID=88925 RepID=UPI00315E00D6